MKSFTDSIKKPTLIIDIERVKKNIKEIADKALRSGVIFRPHFKTHQSAEIGNLFRKEGVECITVSSLEMAYYFAENGWKDITVAFPVNPREVEEINKLASRIKLGILLESREAAKLIDSRLKSNVDAWIEIDTGSFRTGLPHDSREEILELARIIDRSTNMKLSGLLTHAGHTYRSRSKDEVKEIYREMIDRIYSVKNYLRINGMEEILLSIGDTPTASIVSDFSEVDEMRPGNFVFYDVTQLEIGSCREEDIAIALAAPVVAKHQERLEIVIHGGAVHLSKESITLENGNTVYGLVSLPSEAGWGKSLTGSYVKSLSQEHGVIKIQEKFIGKVNIGDIIFVLPVHSCLTANLMGGYLGLNGRSIKTMKTQQGS